jgi:hypothetical protein
VDPLTSCILEGFISAVVILPSYISFAPATLHIHVIALILESINFLWPEIPLFLSCPLLCTENVLKPGILNSWFYFLDIVFVNTLILLLYLTLHWNYPCQCLIKSPVPKLNDQFMFFMLTCAVVNRIDHCSSMKSVPQLALKPPYFSLVFLLPHLLLLLSLLSLILLYIMVCSKAYSLNVFFQLSTFTFQLKAFSNPIDSDTI